MYDFSQIYDPQTGEELIRKGYEIKEQLHISTVHTLFDVHYDCNFSFVGDSHNFWECVYVINGTISETANDKIYSLSTGEMIFHKPFEFHNLQVDNPGGADVLTFSFTENSKFMKYFENKVFKLSEEQEHTMSLLLDFLHSNYIKNQTYINPTLNSYIDCFDNSVTFSQTAIMYIQLLFLQLYDNTNSLVLSSSTSPEAETFKKAVNFMNINISKNLSVAQIAKYCHTSVTRLKQIFFDYVKLSVHKYFLSIKISTATKLLEEGKSVTDVSELLGFSSQSYFSFVYKRETGKNPSEIK